MALWQRFRLHGCRRKFRQKIRVASEQESVFLLDDRVRWRHHPPKVHLQYGVTALIYFCSRNLSRLVTSHCRLKSCEVYPLAEAFQLASFRGGNYPGRVLRKFFGVNRLRSIGWFLDSSLSAGAWSVTSHWRGDLALSFESEVAERTTIRQAGNRMPAASRSTRVADRS